MPNPTQLTVNGVTHSVHAEPDTPLLFILRNDLKLKGAKFGCGLGQCGSCMVLIDGHSVTACDTPLWSTAGKSVTTIEALGTLEAPNALQRAFIAEQAVQCGYCISGILVSATALMKRNPHPSEQDIKQALTRHVCRCGTHVRIVKAQREGRLLITQDLDFSDVRQFRPGTPSGLLLVRLRELGANALLSRIRAVAQEDGLDPSSAVSWC